MSHSQFHCKIHLYLDMHGLIFETSIWLLAGSTRLLSFSFSFFFISKLETRKEPSPLPILILKKRKQKSLLLCFTYCMKLFCQVKSVFLRNTSYLNKQFHFFETKYLSPQGTFCFMIDFLWKRFWKCYISCLS